MKKILFLILIIIGNLNGLEPVYAINPVQTIKLSDAGKINALKFSPDGKYLATIHDKKLIIWNSLTGLKLKELPEGGNVIAFNQKGNLIVSSGVLNKSIKIYDIFQDKYINELNYSAFFISNFTFSPDDRLIAFNIGLNSPLKKSDGITVNFYYYGIQVVDFRISKTVSILNGKRNRFTDFKFSPDNNLIISGHFRSKLKFWEVKNSQLLKTIDNTKMEGEGVSVSPISFSPDNKTFVSSGGYNKVILWDLVKMEKIKDLYNIVGDANKLIFSPDGKKLAVLTTNKLVQIVEPASGTVIKSFKTDINFSEINFFNNGKSLVLASKDGIIEVFDLQTNNSTNSLVPVTSH